MDKNTKSLLEHLGLEATNEVSPLDALSQLMNFSLHCLGGVHQLMAQYEKKQAAKAAAGDVVNTKHVDALKQTFHHACVKILDSTKQGFQISDLDPSRHLIESFPDETKFSDKHWMKLHWAIVCHENFVDPADNICVLAENDPESVRELDKEHRSILHYASRLTSQPLFTAVSSLSAIEHGGFGPGFANTNGALPLHNAARYNSNLAVYRGVLQLKPDAISTPNEAGTLPLHWAAAKNRSVAIVEDIYNSYPEAIKMVNHEGCLPLHTAAQNTTLEVVQCIYEKFPDAIRVRDEEGGYPLHHACCMNSNIHVVQFLYQLFPEAIKSSQTSDGVLPIHLAASKNSSPVVMQFLLEQFPNSASSVDSGGWLPLHCLIANDAVEMRSNRIKCLRLLLQAYPAGIHQKNSSMHTPYELVHYGQHHPFIQRLLLYYAHNSLVKNNNNNNNNNGSSSLIATATTTTELNNMVDLETFHELNWLARKDAVMSLVFYLLQHPQQQQQQQQHYRQALEAKQKIEIRKIPKNTSLSSPQTVIKPIATTTTTTTTTIEVSAVNNKTSRLESPLSTQSKKKARLHQEENSEQQQQQPNHSESTQQQQQQVVEVKNYDTLLRDLAGVNGISPRGNVTAGIVRHIVSFL